MKITALRRIILLPFVILGALNFVSGQTPQSNNEWKYSGKQDTNPTPAVGMEGWASYLEENLQYPDIAQRIGLEGRVFVKFAVKKDGSLAYANVQRGIGAGCDAEAIRLIENAPNWVPGTRKGKPVKTEVMLPILFRLPSAYGSRIIFPADWSSFQKLDRKPEVSGGMDEFEKRFLSKINPPENTHLDINFTVAANGELCNISTGSGMPCEIAYRSEVALQEMSPWQPGVKDGEAVSVDLKISHSSGGNPSTSEDLETIHLTTESDSSEEPVYSMLELKATPTNGQIAWQTYLKENLQYPKAALENNIGGRVMIEFIVEKNGELTNAKVYRHTLMTDNDMGVLAEALRLIENAPKWNPGKARCKGPVRSRAIVTITFRP
ncbi:energy transducer TonB [Roseivirga sp. BDSF3-8]|uniref:energy transducer TonB n=1 Tax=Roseivirga sp. BDSF3-8 TaxID=3241598 RepID=UPI003531B774